MEFGINHLADLSNYDLMDKIESLTAQLKEAMASVIMYTREQWEASTPELRREMEAYNCGVEDVISAVEAALKQEEL